DGAVEVVAGGAAATDGDVGADGQGGVVLAGHQRRVGGAGEGHRAGAAQSLRAAEDDPVAGPHRQRAVERQPVHHRDDPVAADVDVDVAVDDDAVERAAAGGGRQFGPPGGVHGAAADDAARQVPTARRGVQQQRLARVHQRARQVDGATAGDDA